jgi:general secretion pathway protein J
MRAAGRGFTLVEVLVVLVITALVSTLLFQALAQVYRLQERFGEQLGESRSGAMHADWYRQLIQGLLTDYPDGRQRFSGGPRRLEGLSARPLSQEITQAAGGSELRYSAGPQRLALLRWSGAGRSEFAYLDDAGTEHAVWPPQAGGDWPQLPAAVLLRWPARAGQAVLVAAPTGSREAQQRALPALGGLP